MLPDSVKKYLTSSAVNKPYFLFVDDDRYLQVKDDLSALGLKIIRMSDFCNNDDRIPDFDELLSHIDAADVNADGKKFVVTGLGEFLALLGKERARSALSKLKDCFVGGARVILLLRGLKSLIDELKADPRFDSRRYCVIGEAQCRLSFIFVPQNIGLPALKGFKEMLMALESGKNGDILASTTMSFNDALLPVHKISSTYEMIKLYVKEFPLDKSLGSDEYWGELLTELKENEWNIDSVFKKHNINNLDDDFYNQISGRKYSDWLYFICLKYKPGYPKNSYLRFVLEKTDKFDDIKRNVLNSIIDIDRTDDNFSKFYQERKTIIEKFPEHEIASFVRDNRLNISESIYKLTDCKQVEREEIIRWLSENGLISGLEEIYPLLADYLKPYVFKSTLLTDYFERYKRQKLLNKLEPDFLEKVNEFAVSRKFNQLSTRDEILSKIEKDGTHLYWLDALGVEYLGLIEALAQQKNLSIKISIARAELPTITSINRNFYDAWQGEKESNPELDEIKHKDKGGYDNTKNEQPVHLVKELDIIANMIEKAAIKLTSDKKCKRFLIVSDHGASRLAVLRKQEEKYDTDTSGKHSGRCCKLFKPYDLPFATEENDYLVLADYGRFKKSRAANVEVHGGASLEEVVIPIIELSLKDTVITVRLVKEMITVDFRTGGQVELFFNTPIDDNQDVSLLLKEKRYCASRIDDQHFCVNLTDIKKAGDYYADVCVGDDFINKILIKAESKSGKIDSTFDSLF